MKEFDEIIKKLEEDLEEYKRRNEMLSNEVNKHIKEGKEKDVEIKEQNDDVIWWTNRFNAVERDNRKLKEENERLKKELNKHIKEGIEKDQEIERLKENKLRPDELVYLLNQELVRQNKDYKSRNDKAIEYIEEKADYPISYYHCLRELKDILQGSDKE